MGEVPDTGAGRPTRAQLGPEAIAEASAGVQAALEECRPALQADGGDIELVRVTADGIAELRFTGECRICSLWPMTLRAGIERAVLRHAPQVRRVEAVQ